MPNDKEGLAIFKKSRLSLENPFRIGEWDLNADEIIEKVAPLLTDARKERMEEVIKGRTFQVAPILENIYDMGNISAVMRSAEAFGFLNFHIVSSPQQKFKAANRITRGAEKWLDVQIHQSPVECVTQLKQKGFQVYATHLEAAVPIQEIDFSKPTAVVLGNEKDGVSDEMLEAVDGRFIIPMLGFSQSFNISVAAALTFYQAYNVRLSRLGLSGDLTDHEKEMVRANYYLRSLDKPERVLDLIMKRETQL